MRKAFTIFVTKALILILKPFHRGTSFPGQVALKLYPDILKSITLPKMSVAVTGSSGKTTTSAMISNIFEQQGYHVAHNQKGSNLIYGITALILGNVTMNGTFKKDALVMELDERYTKLVFKHITPTYVLITNITKDQPPRHGHYDVVWNDINNSLNDQMTLVLNGDDPLCRSFGIGRPNVIYFGATKNKLSYKNPISNNLEMLYCPKCGHKLNFTYFQYGNVGKYHCSKCSFARPKLDYEATEINFSKEYVVMNDTLKLSLTDDMVYSVYNIVAAYTIANLNGVEDSTIIDSFQHMTFSYARYKEYEVDGRKLYLLSSKNENAPSYNQSLLYTSRKKEPKTVVFGFRRISWRYSHKDISWLWDIDFELLKNSEIDKVVCVGPFAYDLATRINVAGIDEKKIIVDDDYNQLMKIIRTKTKNNIYAILNLDIADYFDDVIKGAKL